jgi:methyl-accepting chemotaxis protein
MKQYRVWEDRVLVTLNEKEKNLSQNKSSVLSELDKDGNGEVDVVEGNDFNLLLKKYQKSIVEVDRNYVQQFVKVSSYIKTKKGNIQSIFNFIKDIPNQELLNEYIEILKDDIHTYNLVLFNSLNMIVSLVEDDMITFYEIHEMFDNLNMFDSKHEKDVSQKLTNIGDGLKDLMYEIRDVGDKISDSIQELIYVTEESNRLLSSQLSEIDSTMKVGNLINTINTYQNYKTNRRLNS